MSIPDIFATYGEEYFRNLETELLIEMQSRKNTVISCGGGRGPAGAEYRRDEEERQGRAPYGEPGDDLREGEGQQGSARPERPERRGGHLRADGAAREKYEAAADIVVNTDGKTVQQSCEEMIRKLTELEEA